LSGPAAFDTVFVNGAFGERAMAEFDVELLAPRAIRSTLGYSAANATGFRAGRNPDPRMVF
jgi:hypothetical protein